MITLTSKIYIQSKHSHVNKNDDYKVLENVEMKIQGFTKPSRLEPES
jgi:hypothetical protein